MSLALDQIKPGVKIRQIAHPEYGDWVIRKFYASTTWEVDKVGSRDGIAVSEGELIKFWELV